MWSKGKVCRAMSNKSWLRRLTSIGHVRGPETFMRRVHLDVILISPETLVPFEHKMPDAVLLGQAVRAAHVWRICQREVRCRRRGLKIRHQKLYTREYRNVSKRNIRWINSLEYSNIWIHLQIMNRNLSLIYN